MVKVAFVSEAVLSHNGKTRLAAGTLKVGDSEYIRVQKEVKQFASGGPVRKGTFKGTQKGISIVAGDADTVKELIKFLAGKLTKKDKKELRGFF